MGQNAQLIFCLAPTGCWFILFVICCCRTGLGSAVVARSGLAGRVLQFVWRALNGSPDMMKQIFALLLTILLLTAHGLVPAALCASAPVQTDGSASKHCKMSQTTTPAPMSCCRPVDRSQRLTFVKKSPGCCHISLPTPNPSRPALPGTSSDEFRSYTQLQASELDLVPVPFQRSLFSSSVSAISFRLDRSDTYLQSSSLRI